MNERPEYTPTPEWLPRKGQEEPEHALHVRIAGRVILYALKAPYTPSGRSIWGGLEFDHSRDELKCHECGKFFEHLGLHVAKMHGMHSSVYRANHGLKGRASLVSERLSRLFKDRGKRLQSGVSPSTRRERMSLASASRKKMGGVRGRTFSGETRNDRGLCKAQLISRIAALVGALGRDPTYPELIAAGISNSVIFYHLGTRKIPEIVSRVMKASQS